MIYVNPEKVIADYPAFKYCEARTSCFHGDAVPVHHNDVFATKFPGKGYESRHTVFTGAGYAVENCEDVATILAKCEGPSTFGNGVSLTAHKREKETIAFLALGSTVCIEGAYYTLVELANQNVGFEPKEG